MTRAWLLLVMALASCSPPARSARYFHAHVDEAAKVLVDCEAGSHRGPECVNAEAGIAQAQRGAFR